MLKSCCVLCCLIGMHKTIVLKPVMALNVLDTEESIPPETPMTKDLALLVGNIQRWLETMPFLKEIEERLNKKMNN